MQRLPARPEESRPTATPVFRHTRCRMAGKALMPFWRRPLCRGYDEARSALSISYGFARILHPIWRAPRRTLDDPA